MSHSELSQTCWLPGIEMPIIGWGHITSWTWSRFLHRIESNWKSEISIRNTGQIRHVPSVRLECMVSLSVQTSSVPLLNWTLVLWQLILTNAWWRVVILIVPVILQTYKLQFPVAGHRNLLMGHWALNIIRLSDFCIQHCVYEK
jgi:hypothetical protein